MKENIMSNMEEIFPQRKDFITTGIVILIQVVISTICFLTLMAVFQFPDILRETSSVRFELFIENQYIIVPIYYLLALTGVSQIIISVLLFQLFPKKSTLVTLGAVFGVLTGLFQILGFIRWSFVIPYFAGLNSSSPELIGILEGAFNSYAGMAIGEHLGFLMQGLWTIFLGIAILKTKLISKILGKIGIVIGVLTILFAFEAFGGIFSILGELTNPVESAWYIWLTFLAISLFRTDVRNLNKVPQFNYIALIIAIICWLLFVIPAYM